MLINPALHRLRQEDQEFKGCLGYTMRPYFKQQQKYVHSSASIKAYLEKWISI
jgi:hypothetical protein